MAILLQDFSLLQKLLLVREVLGAAALDCHLHVVCFQVSFEDVTKVALHTITEQRIPPVTILIWNDEQLQGKYPRHPVWTHLTRPTANVLQSSLGGFTRWKSKQNKLLPCTTHSHWCESTHTFPIFSPIMTLSWRISQSLRSGFLTGCSKIACDLRVMAKRCLRWFSIRSGMVWNGSPSNLKPCNKKQDSRGKQSQEQRDWQHSWWAARHIICYIEPYADRINEYNGSLPQKAGHFTFSLSHQFHSILAWTCNQSTCHSLTGMIKEESFQIQNVKRTWERKTCRIPLSTKKSDKIWNLHDAGAFSQNPSAVHSN